MTNTRDFGSAIVAMKNGYAVKREGWNGKNMCIYLNKGNFDAIGRTPGSEYRSHMNGIPINLFETGDVGTVTRMPNINMKTADGSTVTGWLASQTDMLAEDWTITEN